MSPSPTPAMTPSWTDLRTIGPVLMIVFGLVVFFTPHASVGESGSVGNAGAVFPKCPTPADFETAAAVADDCPPVDDCPEGSGGQVGTGGGAAFVAPDDCPPVDDCPPAFGGNAGNAGIVAPDDCPPVIDPEPEVDAEVEEVPAPPPVAPTGDPDCQPATAEAPGTDGPVVGPDPGGPVLGPDPTEPTTTTTAPGGGGGTVIIGGGVAPDLDDCPEPPAAAATGADAAPSAPAPQRTELARTGVERDTVIASVTGLALVLAGLGLLTVSRRRPA